MYALLAFTLFLSACQPILTGIDRWQLTQKLPVDLPVPCPTIHIMEDLRYFYDLPKTNDPNEKTSFSEAKIENADVECIHNPAKDLLAFKLNIDFTASPGPFTQFMDLQAAPLNTTYFVALVDENNKINMKEKTDLNISFLKNDVDHVTNVTETLIKYIKKGKKQDYTEYTILIGFQLSDAQLKYVRTIMNTESSSPVSESDPLLSH